MPAVGTRARDRWVGVGRSSASDAAQAAAGATASALDGRDDARLLLVFFGAALDPAAVVAGVRAIASGVPRVGCSSSGELDADGPGDDGVVVAALGGDGFAAATAAAPRLRAGHRDAGARAAAALAALPPRDHQVLLLLTDGLADEQQEVVRGAYGVAGAGVPLVGGCAGSGPALGETVQLHGDEILGDAVVAAAIGSDAPLGIGVCHGWADVGDPMVVTGTDGGLVTALDDRPALDVYLERLGAGEDVLASPEAFRRFAVLHPLGLARRSGERRARLVQGFDPEARALRCMAEVPPGGLAWIMRGDADSVLGATDRACAQAVAALGGAPARGVVAFDCVARREVLGTQTAEEVRRLADAAPGAALAGLYVFGEIARTSGVAGFHNQTLVVLALA